MTQEMTVFKKAKDLIEYTFDMTSNKNRYPKKYTFTLVNRIQNLALDIYSKLIKTNESPINKRREMLADILGDIQVMYFLIEFSLKLKRIDKRQCGIWAKKTKDVRCLTAAWKNKYK